MNKKDFEHFEKPTKNPRVILASSARSFSKKRTILTQEGLMQLRNIKRELGPAVQTKYLNLFMLSLKKPGYNKAYKKMVEDEDDSI